MKNLVALFSKESKTAVSTFVEFAMSNFELNAVRGGTGPLPPPPPEWWGEEGE
jgi:hypothetical protein